MEERAKLYCNTGSSFCTDTVVVALIGTWFYLYGIFNPGVQLGLPNLPEFRESPEKISRFQENDQKLLLQRFYIFYTQFYIRVKIYAVNICCKKEATRRRR